MQRARLVELIRAAGTHLATGFLATPYLLPVLADTGHARPRLRAAVLGHDAVLAGHDRPRRDDGVGALGRRSARTGRRSSRSTTTRRARSSRSCTATWRESSCSTTAVWRTATSVYSRGPAAGSPGRRLSTTAPYGRIESSWRIDGDALELTATVPPGTSAEIVLPDGTTETVAAGRHVLRGSAGDRGGRAGA